MTGKMPYDVATIEKQAKLEHQSLAITFPQIQKSDNWFALVYDKMQRCTLQWDCKPWMENSVCADFCQWLLAFDSKCRPQTADEALRHPWLARDECRVPPAPPKKPRQSSHLLPVEEEQEDRPVSSRCAENSFSKSDEIAMQTGSVEGEAPRSPTVPNHVHSKSVDDASIANAAVEMNSPAAETCVASDLTLECALSPVCATNISPEGKPSFKPGRQRPKPCNLSPVALSGEISTEALSDYFSVSITQEASNVNRVDTVDALDKYLAEAGSPKASTFQDRETPKTMVRRWQRGAGLSHIKFALASFSSDDSGDVGARHCKSAKLSPRSLHNACYSEPAMKRIHGPTTGIWNDRPISLKPQRKLCTLAEPVQDTNGRSQSALKPRPWKSRCAASITHCFFATASSSNY
eukprot:gnl/MRDRNA2_/MRDRNA2_176139_c0_seq1.p1 gnl/MRDRNA2_/MRDRNA2_176139_c0~~gnl/MRDRNA2_/MRDRNA2_176139_c0_seq1.p1  ORF type:complete len:421 (+),score=68.08 gnl/MRDRNA2_/MRDRNA2_176139_c0_seq1:44-1264(+)